MNPPGENNVDRFFVAALALKLHQGFHYGFPQDKTGKWPHVPAALPAFEYEPAPALAKEHFEQLRGRSVDIGADTGGLE